MSTLTSFKSSLSIEWANEEGQKLNLQGFAFVGLQYCYFDIIMPCHLFIERRDSAGLWSNSDYHVPYITVQTSLKHDEGEQWHLCYIIWRCTYEWLTFRNTLEIGGQLPQSKGRLSISRTFTAKYVHVWFASKTNYHFLVGLPGSSAFIGMSSLRIGPPNTANLLCPANITSEQLWKRQD